jgi:hypothetical protein
LSHRASGHFRTSYQRDRRCSIRAPEDLAQASRSCAYPFLAGAFALDLANQVLLPRSAQWR